MNVTAPDFVSRVNAAGIPLQLAWVEELGKTYLTDQEIRARASHAVSKIKSYNAFTNNCQFIWVDEILPRIICQCQDQELLKVPSEVQEWLYRITFFVAICIVAASVIVLLRDIGILPFQVKLCSKSNRWGYMCTEISKYWILFRAVQTIFRDHYGNSRLLIPYLDVHELERPLKDLSNKDMIYDGYWHRFYEEVQRRKFDPAMVKLFSDFRDEVVSLVRFYVVCVFLSTMLSLLHRIYVYSLFQGMELILNFIVVHKAWRASTLVGLPGFPSLRQCEAQSWKDAGQKNGAE